MYSQLPHAELSTKYTRFGGAKNILTNATWTISNTLWGVHSVAMFVLFSFGSSNYQLGCIAAALSDQRPVEHVINALQKIMTEWMPQTVLGSFVRSERHKLFVHARQTQDLESVLEVLNLAHFKAPGSTVTQDDFSLAQDGGHPLLQSSLL